MNLLNLFFSTRLSLPHWLSSLARFQPPQFHHFLLFALCHFAAQTSLLFIHAGKSNWMLPGIHSLFITILAILCFIKPFKNSSLPGVMPFVWLNSYCFLISQLFDGNSGFSWFFYCQIGAVIALALVKFLAGSSMLSSAKHVAVFMFQILLVIALPSICICLTNDSSTLQLTVATPITNAATTDSVALFEGFLHGVIALYLLAFIRPVLSPFIKARLIEYIQQDISLHKTMMEDPSQISTLSESKTPKPTTTKSTKSKPSAHYLDQVSILFADMENFSELMQHNATEQVVAFLHDVFNEFDDLCSEFGVAKIKTVGDQYMAASGVPSPHANHAYHCCLLALAMRARFSTICRKHKMNTALRIGISSGSVVAGFVGNDKRSYDLWGDAVNLAARMESSGEANKIQLSHSTYQLVWNQFDFEPVRQIPVKGFGVTSCHYLKDFSNEAQPGHRNLLTTILAKAT